MLDPVPTQLLTTLVATGAALLALGVGLAVGIRSLRRGTVEARIARRRRRRG